MLRVLWRVLSGLPAYLWSGWGAGASLLLLLATWEAVAALYDPLILPDPLTAFAALWAQVAQGAGQVVGTLLGGEPGLVGDAARRGAVGCGRRQQSVF